MILRQIPFGALAAAVCAAALCAAAPFFEQDREATLAARDTVTRSGPAVVAVALDGEDASAVAALARVGGAAEVRAPTTDPLPRASRAPIARLTARALVEGRVPSSALAGRVVVIDSAARAEMRAAAIAAAAASPVTGPARALIAVLAGIVALVAALGVARWLAAATAGALGGTLAIAIVVAAMGFVPPAVELALAFILGAFGGLADRSRALTGLIEAVSGPLLRASAETGAASRLESSIGASLAQLFDARGLLVLETAPGARTATAGAGWRMTASDLLSSASLDPRRPPFRDRDGVVRPSDGEVLLAQPSPATLLPLSSRGNVEGYLLVVHDRGTSLEAAPDAALAACAALAEELRAARLRAAARRGGAALIEAAALLDESGATVAAAAAQASTGLALISPAGTTRWKNARFDETLAELTPGAGTDLARVLTLFRRVGEAPLETLQRLITSDGPVRTAIPGDDRGLTATVTRTGRGLLVEVDELSASALDALSPPPQVSRPELRIHDTAPMRAARPVGG